ncbi:hypothetical protein ONE63_003464 [Megalurothrips usitatus]|uniref:Uncharacterized protein n=1 Tax=Megalurothrips usitatus TaxID=439358 RepID=A0AAV7X7C2_9NEOP|nr:hypothetical protein ONE63_003464 [Megalurothrips usitatus]
MRVATNPNVTDEAPLTRLLTCGPRRTRHHPVLLWSLSVVPALCGPEAPCLVMTLTTKPAAAGAEHAAVSMRVVVEAITSVPAGEDVDIAVSVKGCDVLHRDVLDAHNPSVSHGPESQRGGLSELTGSPAPLNRLGLAVEDGAFLRYEDPQAGAGDVVLPASGAQSAPATPNGHGTRRTTTHQVCGKESRDLRAVSRLTTVTLVAAEGEDWRDAVLRLCSAVNDLDIALDYGDV